MKFNFIKKYLLFQSNDKLHLITGVIIYLSIILFLLIIQLALSIYPV